MAGARLSAGIGMTLLAASLACGVPDPSTPAPPPSPSMAAELATAASMEPAAGICAEAAGPVVTIALRSDLPDPRCAIVCPDQVLEIINDRDASR